MKRIKEASKGFTLAELLIVVAIIAVLVAISIPIFTSKLEAARKATCDSNRRALKAELTVNYLSNDSLSGTPFTDGAVIDEAALSQYYSRDFDFDSFCPNGGVISAKFENGTFSVYCSIHDPEGTATPSSWESGVSYKVGDRVSSNGYIFECTLAHTSGSGSYSKDPGTGTGNKTRWKVIGYVGGAIKSYSSTLHYAEGVKVTYNGKTYVRTNYNLGTDQTPASSSSYWSLV